MNLDSSCAGCRKRPKHRSVEGTKALTAVAAGCHRHARWVGRRRAVVGRWRVGFEGWSARVRDLSRYRGWLSAASVGGRREWTSARIKVTSLHSHT